LMGGRSATIPETKKVDEDDSCRNYGRRRMHMAIVVDGNIWRRHGRAERWGPLEEIVGEIRNPRYDWSRR